METQFFFDQMISLCHVLMNYENIHFTLDFSNPSKRLELSVYFDFNDDAVINAILDYVSVHYPFFCTTLIVYKDKDPFKVLKVRVK